MSHNAIDNDARPGAFSIAEFAKNFSIGRSKVYELIGSGELKSYHVGRRILISYQAATEWQRSLEQRDEGLMDRG